MSFTLYNSVASLPIFSQWNQLSSPTTGSVSRPNAAPVSAIAPQNRQRRMSSGTRKNAKAHTGLNANSPHTTPPATLYPRLASAHPHTRMQSEIVGF